MSSLTFSVLVVDDDEQSLYFVERVLGQHGIKVVRCERAEEAMELATKERPSLLLVDVLMPGLGGFELTKLFKSHPEFRFLPLILRTSMDASTDVAEGLELGADDYISKSASAEELVARVRAALRLRSLYGELKKSEELNRELLSELSGRRSKEILCTKSSSMSAVLKLIDKVAKSSVPVMITGESGVGKELVARTIHSLSEQRVARFVAKNCATFPPELAEAELFGSTRGAFTGAVKDTKGLFESADGGTLFLDEIGDLPLGLQAKLLRVLQEGVITPVGSTVEREVRVRVVAATHRNLEQMVKEGTFREDLFFRLNVVPIAVPPLRERSDDIEILVEHILARASARTGRVWNVSPQVMQAFKNYSWPGNVRELENEIERLLVLSDDESMLGIELLSPRIRCGENLNGENTQYLSSNNDSTLKSALEEVERSLISNALKETGGNKSEAARRLGISRSSLIMKAQEYQLGGVSSEVGSE